MSLEKEPGRLPSEVTPWLGKEESHELTDNMQLSRAARRLLADSMAKNTILAFRSDIRGFLKAGYSLPATSHQVANYLAEMHAKGRKPATISRHASSLGTWHVYMQLPSPTLSLEVKGVLKGIHRKSDGRQRQAPALRLHHLQQLLQALDLDAPRDLRDASMFCLCFYGAFRASEVVALYREDIEWRDGGIVITLRHSKTNQSGRIEQKTLPRNPSGGRCCPVTLLEAWLAWSGIRRGALYRSIDQADRVGAGRMHPVTFGNLLKKALQRANLSAEKFTTHSFRAGFITEAHLRGKSDQQIKRISGHRDQKTFERYIRLADDMHDPGNDLF